MTSISGCHKEVSRSPVESEAPKGFIYINSTPNGFTIFQNGRNTGRLTPDSISYIESGIYEITLKKKYFKDTSVVITIGENEKLTLSVDIASNPSMYGKLFLQSTPLGADIILNDSVTNKVTPTTFSNLLPGDYNVKFSLPNHRTKEIAAIVQSSKTNSYNGELRDTSVWVDYQFFNSGIQSNSLTAIALDNNNVKWIGSLDKGLIRYDGISFINYDKTNSSLPSNKINCIAIDYQNRIWVGTNFGIGIFDGSSWIIYNRNNSGLTSEMINTIRFDNTDNAWIGTAGNLVKFDGINWNLYNEPKGKDWINDIYIESESKLWLGTKADGVRTFVNENFDSLLQSEYGYPSMTITSIASDNFDNIWFCFVPDSAGRGGASYWNGSGFTNFFFGTPQNNVNNIFVYEQDNKWIATSECFVHFDDQNNSTVFNTSNSLISSNNIRASVHDQNGNVWITTLAAGLNKYKAPR
ncbi:MAG: PEGA domain-containing protein [Ignavibacteriaceae bacterium]|nr:PEGA domain-containing protein [Ignavibacteriaceae bacterium]